MIRFLLSLIALCLMSGAVSAAPTEARSIVQLRALDKATARVDTIEAPLERPVQFGTLLIIAHDCHVSPPEEQPEAAAFLEISEFKPGTQGSVKFRGWMFASSPALSALEHPVYDIWVTGCKNPAAKVEAAPAAPAPAPAAAPTPTPAPSPRAVLPNILRKH